MGQGGIGEEMRGGGLLSLQKRREEENQGEKDKEERRGMREKESSPLIKICVRLGLLGVLALGAEAALGRTEERLGDDDPSKQCNPGVWWCAVLVLHTTAKRGISGLLVAAAAVTVVWIVEILSMSKGLLTTVLDIPSTGLVIGGGVGAMEGVGRAAELLGPGVFWEAVTGGVRGAETGARVAVTGGVAIGGIMCALAAVAVKNIMIGGELRVAPLMTVSVVVGATRMVLCLAPESMAMGALVGAVFGSAWDVRVLSILGMVGVVGCFGFRLLRSVPENMNREAVLTPKLTGVLVGGGVAVILTTFLGFPIRLLSALVRVPVGVAIAFLVWKMGQVACQSMAEVTEKLFAAISVNTHYRHAEAQQ